MSKSHLTRRERIANNLPYRDKVPTHVRERFVRRFMNRHKVLISYLRDKNRVPFGVVVAFKEKDEIVLGHALWNPVEPWNKLIGLDWAIQRALAGKFESVRHSNDLDAAYIYMRNKAMKYFKTCRVGEYPHLPRMESPNFIYGTSRVQIGVKEPNTEVHIENLFNQNLTFSKFKTDI